MCSIPSMRNVVFFSTTLVPVCIHILNNPQVTNFKQYLINWEIKLVVFRNVHIYFSKLIKLKPNNSKQYLISWENKLVVPKNVHIYFSKCILEQWIANGMLLITIWVLSALVVTLSFNHALGPLSPLILICFLPFRPNLQHPGFPHWRTCPWIWRQYLSLSVLDVADLDPLEQQLEPWRQPWRHLDQSEHQQELWRQLPPSGPPGGHMEPTEHHHDRISYYHPSHVVSLDVADLGTAGSWSNQQAVHGTANNRCNILTTLLPGHRGRREQVFFFRQTWIPEGPEVQWQLGQSGSAGQPGTAPGSLCYGFGRDEHKMQTNHDYDKRNLLYLFASIIILYKDQYLPDATRPKKTKFKCKNVKRL